jgi:hypothetical protein
LGQFRDKKSLDRHEKSLDLSNYEIFPQKILKSRTFKKSSILIVKNSFEKKEKYHEFCCYLAPLLPSISCNLEHANPTCYTEKRNTERKGRGASDWGQIRRRKKHGLLPVFIVPSTLKREHMNTTL